MIQLPDRLLTQDLLLRPADPQAMDDLPDTAQALDELRIIDVRSSGKQAGFVGRTADGIWLELDPEHRSRGRGTEAFSVCLEALLSAMDEVIMAEVDQPAARGFLRRFCFRQRGDGRWVTTAQTRQRLAEMIEAQLRRYRQRVTMTMLELGIPSEYGIASQLPMVAEARVLDSIGRDIHDREQFMQPQAAQAFRQLQSAARADGIDLQPVSAFRGFDYQVEIILRKMRAGQPIDEVLRVSAVPGYSEHHSGRAVDITEPRAEALEESFESTEAFSWMCENAEDHGFELSYPRDNPHGIIYEPWHWRYGKAEVLG